MRTWQGQPPGFGEQGSLLIDVDPAGARRAPDRQWNRTGSGAGRAPSPGAAPGGSDPVAPGRHNAPRRSGSL